ncbi:hypothetical protein [Leucobacter sp. OH1287]|uniref:hypothetical protein n=1 Tax=Leucobacter sp. OH1287 TaxID=2491049 RepID=UPI000F5EC4C6|nr:hypothetical protein [Leucobacter sp. OH1287]RRD59517.1 hypothetical protein EII30_08515 [Leucobacter sp. OH1287]
MENSEQTYHVAATDLWREMNRLHEKTGDDYDKALKRLPEVQRRLGLPTHEQMSAAVLNIAEKLEEVVDHCPVCSGGVFKITFHPVGDVVAGAEELLKRSAAADSEKIARSRWFDETLREHDELGGEGE